MADETDPELAAALALSLQMSDVRQPAEKESESNPAADTMAEQLVEMVCGRGEVEVMIGK